jgi:hypothetical protein
VVLVVGPPLLVDPGAQVARLILVGVELVPVLVEKLRPVPGRAAVAHHSDFEFIPSQYAS